MQKIRAEHCLICSDCVSLERTSPETESLVNPLGCPSRVFPVGRTPTQMQQTCASTCASTTMRLSLVGFSGESLGTSLMPPHSPPEELHSRPLTGGSSHYEPQSSLQPSGIRGHGDDGAPGADSESLHSPFTYTRPVTQCHLVPAVCQRARFPPSLQG